MSAPSFPSSHRQHEPGRSLAAVRELPLAAVRDAARMNDLETLKRFLDQRPPARERQEMLRLGILERHVDVVKLMVPVCNVREKQSVALSLAARTNLPEIAAFLLPFSDAQADNSRALNLAARLGHIDCVRLLLPWSDPSASDSDALRAAISNGHEAIVALLLPVSPMGSQAHKFLMSAAYSGSLSILSQVLARVPPDTAMELALLAAVRSNNQPAVALLLPATLQSQALQQQRRNGVGMERWSQERAMSERMVKDASNPWELIVTAVESGHRDLVAWLLDRADASAHASAALRAAVRRGDDDMVTLLLPYSNAVEALEFALQPTGKDLQFTGALAKLLETPDLERIVLQYHPGSIVGDLQRPELHAILTERLLAKTFTLGPSEAPVGRRRL